MQKKLLSSIPSGHDGDGYVTIGGKVCAAFKIASVSAELKVTSEKRRFLGERMAQNAPRAMEGSGKISYYHTTAALMDAMKSYREGGEYPAITIQYHADGDGGRCEVVLRRVVLDQISFGKIDDNSDDAIINQSGFTFDDFDVIERF